MADPDYLNIREIPIGQTVHRTVEVGDGLLVDLNEDGDVLGVENVHGQVGIHELATVLRWLRTPKETDDDHR